MQGRGLKLCLLLRWQQMATVAPHAGAWIETDAAGHAHDANRVAPHAGAWIETRSISSPLCLSVCRPSCRGVD